MSWSRAPQQRACSKPVGGAGAAAPLQLEEDLLGLAPTGRAAPAPPADPMSTAPSASACKWTALQARREEALTRALALNRDRVAASALHEEAFNRRCNPHLCAPPALTHANSVSTSDAEHIKRLMDYHQRLGQSCFVSYALGGRQADGTWAVHSGSFGTTAFPFLLEMDRPSSFKNRGEAEAALFAALEAKFGRQDCEYRAAYEPRTLFHMRIGPYREAGGARDKADAAAAELARVKAEDARVKAERHRAVEECGEIRKIGNEYYIVKGDEVFKATRSLTCEAHVQVCVRMPHRLGGPKPKGVFVMKTETRVISLASLTIDEIRSLRGPCVFATVKDAESHWAMAAEMAEVLAEDARILAEAKRRLAEEERATAEAEREARIKAVMDSLRR